MLFLEDSRGGVADCVRRRARRYARLPHYDLLRRVHHENEAEAEEKWKARSWAEETQAQRTSHFTAEMLSKVRTLVPMFWRCARDPLRRAAAPPPPPLQGAYWVPIIREPWAPLRGGRGGCMPSQAAPGRSEPTPSRSVQSRLFWPTLATVLAPQVAVPADVPGKSGVHRIYGAGTRSGRGGKPAGIPAAH